MVTPKFTRRSLERARPPRADYIEVDGAGHQLFLDDLGEGDRAGARVDRRDAGVNAARSAILYDADCGFCRWALGWVLRWDRGRRLRPVALQDAEADVLLSEVEPELRMASWHLVDDDGTVRSGGDAAAPLLELLPGGGPAAAAVTRGSWPRQPRLRGRGAAAQRTRAAGERRRQGPSRRAHRRAPLIVARETALA